MSAYRLHSLPYARDSAALLRQLSALPGLVCLDSGLGDSPHGRFDILSALPDTLPAAQQQDAHTDAFAAVQALLSAQSPETDTPAALSHLPFLGGVIGYVDYGGALRAGLYRWAIVVDHQREESLVCGHPSCPEQTWARVLQALQAVPQDLAPFTLQAPFCSNFSEDEYATAFAQIQDYLHAGDCYQVNLAQRFHTRYVGSPLAAFLRLRQQIHSPFSAYMHGADQTLLSFSPERFLKLHDGQVLTQPIKGTRRRSSDPEEDRALAAALLASPKDRAENLMIVDLLRNDIGSLCATGSVRVDSLFELHSFSNVHHLVSSIGGRLEAPHGAMDLLRNCFPGGSITGAPKKRAMQIIAELEPDARQAYCGSMFYADFRGNMDSNILIRSLLCTEEEVFCWGGGGIVADSICAQEYQECYDKINNIIKAL